MINGKIVGTLGIARDITERKKAEERTRESEERYRSLVELAPDSIMTFDLKGVVTSCNTASARLSGYSKDELVGKHFSRAGVLRARDIPKYLKMLPFTVRGKVPKPFEVIWQHKNGTSRLGEVRVSLTREKGKITGIQAIMRDITERKKAEEALRASEGKLNAMLQSIGDRMSMMDKDLNILWANETAKKIFGDDIIGEKCYEVYHGRKKPCEPYPCLMLKAFQDGKVHEHDTQVIDKDGKIICFHCTANVALRDKEGRPTGVMEISRDITEHKKAEEALRESEEKYRELLNGMNDTAWVIDFDCNFIDVNDVAVKVLGYSREELLSMGIFDIDSSLDPEEIRGLVKGMPADEVQVFETAHTTKDGKTIPVEISSSLATYKGKQAILSIARDITERKQMEKKLQVYSEHLEELVGKRTRQLKEAHEQLLKAERLAAIGEMAAMIGHDLRNPLTGIAGATYYLKTKLGSKMDKKVAEMLDLVQKSIEYSNKIISDLLEYSRKIRLELTETTPKSIIKDALALIKIPKNIRISDLTENKPKIKVDVQKIERVFVNIIKNAIDAMSKGGTLTITSKESNGNLQIAFFDTGVGMPKEVMERIWIPLFTTKAKGMGLGLPICKRIVEAHRGDISVESTARKGTTFLVTIPVKPKLEGGEKIWVNVPESLLSTTTKA